MKKGKEVDMMTEFKEKMEEEVRSEKDRRMNDMMKEKDDKRKVVMNYMMKEME